MCEINWVDYLNLLLSTQTSHVHISTSRYNTWRFLVQHHTDSTHALNQRTLYTYSLLILISAPYTKLLSPCKASHFHHSTQFISASHYNARYTSPLSVPHYIPLLPTILSTPSSVHATLHTEAKLPHFLGSFASVLTQFSSPAQSISAWFAVDFKQIVYAALANIWLLVDNVIDILYRMLLIYSVNWILDTEFIYNYFQK